MRRKQLHFYEKEKRINMALLSRIGMWLFQIAVVAAMGGVAAFFWGQKSQMIGASMEPGIASGAQVYKNRAVYMLSTPKRFDVIVFKPNGNKKEHDYIKRVIGMPGETIQIKDGSIYIDGEKLEEPMKFEAMDDAGIAAQPYKIGNEEYFVLGDNRNNSEDSRYADIGTIKFDAIEGSAWLWSRGGLSFGKIE